MGSWITVRWLWQAAVLLAAFGLLAGGVAWFSEGPVH